MELKPHNPKSLHAHNRNAIAISLVIIALMIASIAIPNYMPVKATVPGTNPTLINEVTNQCVGCGASANEFGTINSGNGFNPASFGYQGMLNVIYCSGATTNAFPVVTSITDTLGDTWTQITSLGVSGLTTHDNAEKSFANYIWYSNLVVTGSTSFVMTINFSPNAGKCQFVLYLASYGITPLTFAGEFEHYTTGSGIFLTNLNILLTTGLVNTPPGTIVFESNWLNSTQTDPLTFLQANQLGLIYTQSSSLGVGTAWDFVRNYDGYYPNGLSGQAYLETISSTSSPGNSNYLIGHLVVLLSTTAQQPSSCNPNCNISGGGSNISKTIFSMNANTTYYYVAQTGIGGILLNNISSKISSYINNGAGKSNDTLQLTIYQSSCSVNGVATFSLTCPYTNFGLYSQSFFLNNGITNQWIHTPPSFSIAIPADSSYVIALISKYSGLSIFTTDNVQPMFSTTEGLFSGATWKPPTTITLQTLTTPQLFIEWFGTINPSISTSTSTITSIATCSSGSTCTTGTSTQINVQTTILYSTATGSNSRSSVGIIQDTETYFPVWIFPLIFSPFGIQGVLIGFIVGIVMGALLGIVPLWAAFILSLGLVYVLIRR